ncbi:hypothetical protein I5M27_09235 [Adhaeribacter sp. BT258]|uniref:Glycosyltransferase RgtA/B/C/D-like domain-containing protein n=1 Tax=Adhaeribacter terrigena TaxID=2793070 RepID=A0ABS1C188_9BACT|nr:hypothetical protein [Adhaeribacter terrigena]MBK0403167.1 hypothetical protein [Adhaeribacter terrigena]
MQNDYRQVLRYGLGMLAVAAGFLLLFFLSWSYQELQPVFAAFNSDKPWLAEGLVEIKHTFGISETVYTMTKAGVAVLFAGCIFLLYRLRSTSHASFFSAFLPSETVAFFGQKLRKQWQQLPAFEKKLLLVTILTLTAVRLYLLHLYEYEIDEASAYFLFLYRGWPGVITYYAIPNNHIFYSLLCLPLLSVFQDPYWAYKLPTLLISTLGFPVLYLAVRSVFKFGITFFAVTGLSFSYHLLYYAVHGRGYSLLLLCTAFAFIAILKLYEGRQNDYWLAFLVCTVTGFYTVPVFLYPFAGISVFAFLAFIYSKNYRALRQFMIVAFFAGITTLLLYLPVILVSSPELLFSNVYVVRQPYAVMFSKLSFFFPFTQGSVLGQESKSAYLWLLAILSLFLLLIFRRKATGFWQYTGLQPVYLIWILCGALVPWMLIFVQGVLPPERTWTYKAFSDFLAVAVLLQILFYFSLRKRKKLTAVMVVLFMAFYGTYETVKHWRNHQVPHTSSAPFYEILTAIRQQPDPVIYTSDGYYSFFIRYDFLAHAKRPPVMDEFQTEPGKNYNVLILSRTNPVKTNLDLARFRLIHEDNFVQVYFLKRPK